MPDPNQDNRFGRSWNRDYGRTRREARQQIAPRWLVLLLTIGVLLVIGLLLFSVLSFP